jgi:hypothetical protein
VFLYAWTSNHIPSFYIKAFDEITMHKRPVPPTQVAAKTDIVQFDIITTCTL